MVLQIWTIEIREASIMCEFASWQGHAAELWTEPPRTTVKSSQWALHWTQSSLSLHTLVHLSETLHLNWGFLALPDVFMSTVYIHRFPRPYKKNSQAFSDGIRIKNVLTNSITEIADFGWSIRILYTNWKVLRKWTWPANLPSL